MGFIDAYKRLEKLCKEMNGSDRPVSAYIDEMVNTPHGARYVAGWDTDLKNLKHYRWVRNRISHDPGCTEENMSNLQDEKWVTDFYDRIMRQEDPLFLYHKATSKSRSSRSDKPSSRQDEPPITKQEIRQTLLGYAIMLFIAAAAVAIVGLLTLLYR